MQELEKLSNVTLAIESVEKQTAKTSLSHVLCI